MSDIQTDEGFFSARDGLRLFWHTARAAAPVAHVAVVHGYAEHLGRHSEVTRALEQYGRAAFKTECLRPPIARDWSSAPPSYERHGARRPRVAGPLRAAAGTPPNG